MLSQRWHLLSAIALALHLKELNALPGPSTQRRRHSANRQAIKGSRRRFVTFDEKHNVRGRKMEGECHEVIRYDDRRRPLSVTSVLVPDNRHATFQCAP